MSRAGKDTARSRAAAWGFEYVWVDTCCIDKTSSAELSEAINSMFSWYQKADVCYVYLSDYLFPARKDNSLDEEFFKNSRWFTRGWTLQELIAPESVVFFNESWHDIGTKHSLGQISKISVLPRGCAGPLEGRQVGSKTKLTVLWVYSACICRCFMVKASMLS
jgi:hypothetical protein